MAEAAPATLITAAIATIAALVGIKWSCWRSTTPASTKPRVSPSARMPSVTRRRFPSVRRRSDGTSSWAELNAYGRTPMIVAAATGVPSASRSGIVRPSPASAKTAAAVRAVPP